MRLLPIFTTLVVGLSLLVAAPVNAKQPLEPGDELILLWASTLGLSRDDFNQAFNTIADFQAGKFGLPQLESLSDNEVLAKIDFAAEPYASLESEQLMLFAKRYEIETTLLAERAGVDIDKFNQMYRTFDATVTLALRLNLNHATQQNAMSSLNYFDEDDFNGPLVECNRSCEAVREQIWNEAMDSIGMIGDMQDWESRNGPQDVGTVARIVDSESGNFIEVRRQHSSMPWAPIRGGSNGSNCGAVACI